MKLKQFIEELKEISKKVDNPESVEIQIANCVPVVNPILKNNTVYITDVEDEG